MNTLDQLKKLLGRDDIKENVDLSQYTTIRMKFPARYFIEARSEKELLATRKVSTDLDIPYLLLGGGSNIVPLGIMPEGLVVLNKFVEKNWITKGEEARLEVSSGYPLSKLVLETISEGYGGLECLLGIPGTVGGAVFMNSKWTHPISAIGDSVESAYLISSLSELKEVRQEYFKFGVGYSALQDSHEILTRITFRLKKTDPSDLRLVADKALDHRKKTQPREGFSCGCFFRNPTGVSAGYLIDKAGLKGYSVGAFQVSKVHANFIIHLGGGSKTDLNRLIDTVKEKIETKFGVTLHEEVILI